MTGGVPEITADGDPGTGSGGRGDGGRSGLPGPRSAPSGRPSASASASVSAPALASAGRVVVPEPAREVVPAPRMLPDRRLAVTYEAFHDSEYKSWVRYALLHTGSREAAEEIAGAVSFRLAVTWLDVLRQESVPACTWRILKEQVAGWLSAHERCVTLAGAAAFEAVSSALCDGEVCSVPPTGSREALFSAISRLPERQRDVIVLRYGLGYDDELVAELLGLGRSTVRSCGRAAKRRIAIQLGAASARRAPLPPGADSAAG